ncbi:MAG: acyl carrier protein [Candidatus Omnitrophota bacterium]
MDNRERLKKLFMDVFLLSPEEFSFELKREDISAWDSFGVVALAAALDDVFGCRISAEEAMDIRDVAGAMRALEKKGISFHD